MRSCNARTSASSAGERRHARGDVLADLRLRERVERRSLRRGRAGAARGAPSRADGPRPIISVTRKLAEPQQPRRRAAAREVVDELHRGVVAPVQVLGDQQQRPILGVAIEQLAHLAQHAGLAGRRTARAASASRSSGAARATAAASSHVGATARISSTSDGSRRHSSVSASRIGRYGSPAPYCSTHCPCAQWPSPTSAHEAFDHRCLADAGLARRSTRSGACPRARLPCGAQPRRARRRGRSMRRGQPASVQP